MINSDEATVITTDGDYKLCVKMTDAAGNPAVFDDTVQFVVDKTAPSITAVSTSSSVIDDGYLNSTEAAASTDLVTSVTTLDVSDSVEYLVQASGDTCDDSTVVLALVFQNQMLQ